MSKLGADLSRPGPQWSALALRPQTEGAPRSRSPSYFQASADLVLRRKCDCGQSSGDEECASCPQPKLSRQAAAGSGESPDVPELVREVLGSPGQMLEPEARSFLEPRFGQDLGQVRIHRDTRAAESARAVDALAYTVGSHVVFASGRYAPGTDAGRRLLAHELAHTFQQDGGPAPGAGSLRISEPHEASEQEADRTARGVMEHGAAAAPGRVGGGVLQRQPAGVPELDPNRNLGPPISPLPKPPNCSFIWKEGKPYWKCEDIPKIGGTPDIPLDPRDIPDEIRKKFNPKKEEKKEPPPWTSGCPEERRTPNPFVCCEPGQKWFDGRCEDAKKVDEYVAQLMCRLYPALCPPAPKTPAPPPGTPGLPPPKPGVVRTLPLLFNQDEPKPGAKDPRSGLTSQGSVNLAVLMATLNGDPDLQVELVGMTSSEGPPDYNLSLSERRVQGVFGALGELSARVADTAEPGISLDKCVELGSGRWKCGEAQASKEVVPEERVVKAIVFRPAK